MSECVHQKEVWLGANIRPRLRKITEHQPVWQSTEKVQILYPRFINSEIQPGSQDLL